MVDVTTINNRVRQHLAKSLDEAEFQIYGDATLSLPHFEGDHWYVNVIYGFEVVGTVVLDNEGNVMEKVSFPHTLDSLTDV